MMPQGIAKALRILVDLALVDGALLMQVVSVLLITLR